MPQRSDVAFPEKRQGTAALQDASRGIGCEKFAQPGRHADNGVAHGVDSVLNGLVLAQRMMMKIISAVLSMLLAISGHAQTNTAGPSAVSPFGLSTQLVLVTTKGWDAVPGVMQRFERADSQLPWKKTGAAFPVVVGHNGLGWGRGINPPANLPGPIKHEGDGKSPAGIFRLSSAFGMAAADEMKYVKLSYHQLTNGVECVDDMKSARYNSITDPAQAGKPDWDSSEKMWRATNAYRLGIVVDHNSDPAEPGGGSCVFIHLWDDAATGTSGCTAMAPASMDALLPWLDPAAKPVLVQLTVPAYQQLQKIWQLP
jgi:D-alanyl-D-alanine dipeptidase